MRHEKIIIKITELLHKKIVCYVFLRRMKVNTRMHFNLDYLCFQLTKKGPMVDVVSSVYLIQ